MIHVLALFLISTLAGCASCSSDLKENGKENGKEEKPDTEAKNLWQACCKKEASSRGTPLSFPA